MFSRSDTLNPMSELPVSPVAAPAFAVPFAEDRYQETMALLRNPKQRSQGLVLVLSLAAFVLFQKDSSPLAVAVLVGVLLFHELGHYAGMRVFGYRDVRMFFIPFLGAAVSGKRRNVAPWKEGIVLLLGPLPGIVAAFVLARQGLHDASGAVTPLYSLAVSLVSINGFNLLPLAGLDGARLLQHVIFSRRRWLEIGFQLCAALAMAAFALWAESIVLGVLVYLMLIILPYRWRLLGVARRLREEGHVMPVEARELDDEVGRVVFTHAHQVLTDKNQRPKLIAPTMDQLVDAVSARPPSIGASFALTFTWLAGLVFAIVTLALVYGPPPAAPGSDVVTPETRQAPAPEAP